ncbi:hypothetical protein BCR33DRAFT_736279 [Rhizoclosmatium globosum]|uniref:Uncharacterized protein n=1 Tax=Rhizoclosmatium globosum TaxID=329046 RepID=A0A1Y2CKG8_9FUNG|nr:hypothetical protein BCR33DRAFT_736279 [Rhizoclosmatium globosum]|eukprot:ORY47486.1 hypothetical protein BCR33DRAFT_736279 [Rhizoclosmatium globosum]
MAEYSFIQYSASRGLSIVKRAYPSLALSLDRFMKVMPFIVFAPVIPATIDAVLQAWNGSVGNVVAIVSPIEMVLSCIALAVTYVFDAVMMAGFSKFIMIIQATLGSESDASYPLVARFGCYAGGAFFLGLTSYVIAIAAGLTGFWYNFVMWFAYFIATWVLVFLIWMKVAIRGVKRGSISAGSGPTKRRGTGTAGKSGGVPSINAIQNSDTIQSVKSSGPNLRNGSIV